MEICNKIQNEPNNLFDQKKLSYHNNSTNSFKQTNETQLKVIYNELVKENEDYNTPLPPKENLSQKIGKTIINESINPLHLNKEKINYTSKTEENKERYFETIQTIIVSSNQYDPKQIDPGISDKNTDYTSENEKDSSYSDDLHDECQNDVYENPSTLGDYYSNIENQNNFENNDNNLDDYFNNYD